MINVFSFQLGSCQFLKKKNQNWKPPKWLKWQFLTFWNQPNWFHVKSEWQTNFQRDICITVLHTIWSLKLTFTWPFEFLSEMFCRAFCRSALILLYPFPFQVLHHLGYSKPIPWNIVPRKEMDNFRHSYKSLYETYRKKIQRTTDATKIEKVKEDLDKKPFICPTKYKNLFGHFIAGAGRPKRVCDSKWVLWNIVSTATVWKLQNFAITQIYVKSNMIKLDTKSAILTCFMAKKGNCRTFEFCKIDFT